MANPLIPLALVAMVSLQPDAPSALRDAARLEQAGDTAGALTAYRRALEDARPGSGDRATALMALAGLETDVGQYGESARHANEAAGLFKAVGDSAGTSNALNRAGLAALYEAKYAEAEQAIRAALDISTKTGDLEGRAEQLTNLANVHYFVGRYADAARLYDEALAVTTASAGEAWAARRRRLVLANQASLYQRLGRDQQALALYETLGATGQELRPREQAQLLVNLGVLYRRLGDPIKALATYDTARTLFARERQVDGELGVLKNRGIVLALDLGRLDAAEQSFTDALNRASQTGNRREMLHARLYRGETRLRAGRPRAAAEDFAVGLSLSRELSTPEEEWKALYGLGRADQGSAAAVAYLRQAVSTIERIRERIRVPLMRSEFLNDKREVYDALITVLLQSASREALFNLLERSHSRGWRERLDLPASIDLPAVQRAPPPRTLLLDYWTSPAGSAVVAVSPSQTTVIRVQADPATIKALIDSLAAGPSGASRDLAAGLAARLLPPGDWFNGIDRVIVVPDGAVALVPFDVLPSGGRLLVERVAVSYLPTAAMLLRSMPVVSDRFAPWHLELRAFGDPVFSVTPMDERGRRGGRLPASADEVRQVASELAGRAELHLGPDNRKAHLLERGGQAPVLHLATHALVDAEAMEQSRLLFSPAADGQANADYLFLKEAYELPLDGVELAVLSACDTERGRLVRGEGVQSFSRAFLAAGARSTVTTLWRVADEPTSEFMRVFYYHLQRGLPRDEALRRAKLKFLTSETSLADPHFWATFVLTGDAARPLPRAVSWRSIVVGVLAVSAAASWSVLVFRRRRRLPPSP